MSIGDSTTHDPLMDYTAPEAEWTALLTLAAQPVPARALGTGGWKREYFYTPGVAEAYAQIATADAPVVLALPPEHDGLSPLADGSTSLTTLRATLAQLAQKRALATLVSHFSAKLKKDEPSATAHVADLLSEARKALDIASKLGRAHHESSAAATLGDLTADYWPWIQQQRDAIPTGFSQLDNALGGGLQPQRLVTLLGAPGQGKTTFANQIATHIADAGRPVVYLTTEDTKEMLMAKTVARLGKIDYTHVQYGPERLRAKIEQTLADMRQRKSAQRLLYLENSGGLSLDDLAEQVRAHFTRYDEQHGGGRGLLVVDYLQRVARAQREASGVARDLREAVTLLTERLRDLSRDLDCTVLALASQSRASYNGNGANVLASAKESGDIEYTADVIMGLAKDDERSTHGAMVDGRSLPLEPYKLVLAKNRQGRGQGHSIECDWLGAYQQWTEVSE